MFECENEKIIQNLKEEVRTLELALWDIRKLLIRTGLADFAGTNLTERHNIDRLVYTLGLNYVVTPEIKEYKKVTKGE